MAGLKKGTKLKKECKECGEMKYLKEFPPDKRTKSGISSYCLDCMVKRKLKRGAPKNGGNGVEKTSNDSNVAYCPHCHGPIRVELDKVSIYVLRAGDPAPAEKLHKRPNRRSKSSD